MTLWQGIQALGGLGIFLFSLRFLTSVLNRSISRRFKPLLARLLGSHLRGVGVGVGATLVAQASSITIIATMGLLQSSLISLDQGFFVMLGATVGTTLKAWFFAENAQSLGPLLIGLTSLALVFVRHPLGRELLEAVLSIGLGFLGLQLLGDGLAPLAHQPAVAAWLEAFDGSTLGHQALGLLTGLVLTMLLQSSSTLVFVVIGLAAQGLIGLPAGAALVLGANVGTTLTPLLASLEYNREVKRLALSHLLVKLLGALVALLLFPQLLAVSELLVGRGQPIGLHLAAFHTTFNVLNVLVWAAGANLMFKLLDALMPRRGEGNVLLPPMVRKLLASSPERALQEVQRQTQALQTLAKDLSDECLALLVETPQERRRARKPVWGRNDVENVKDGVYELLMTQARGKLDPQQEAFVRHQLQFASICAKLGQQALDFKLFLEQGMLIELHTVPAELQARIPDLQDVFDQLWVAIIFRERRPEDRTAATRAFQQETVKLAIEMLDDAYFEFLKSHEIQRNDASHWILDAVTHLRYLTESLKLLYDLSSRSNHP